ncbi:MAG: 30S ribosomal protein S17 [Minisyncoccia bacterium]
MEEKSTKKNIGNGKVLHGVVVATKMKDTITVSVSSYNKHPQYGKFIKRDKKYLVHSPANTHTVGELIDIIETRPISKNKRFKVLEK